MANETLDLRLPFQPQGITAHWLLPTKLYCLVTEARVYYNLPRVALVSGAYGIRTRM